VESRVSRTKRVSKLEKMLIGRVRLVGLHPTASVEVGLMPPLNDVPGLMPSLDNVEEY
jgi:hypothetical protein